MRTRPSPNTDDSDIEADKLLTLDDGDIIEYEAYDSDCLGDDREKHTYRKEVTNITRVATDSSRVYVHVEDCETGDQTILSANTRHNRKGLLYRTGGIKETMGPYAGHPDSWTRSVLNIRVADV